MKLEWDFNSGGAMGPNMLLRLGGHCVGHFYEDAHSTINADEVRDDIATRYNAHDALVAALEAVQHDGKKYRSVMSGTTLAAVDAALALARPQE